MPVWALLLVFFLGLGAALESGFRIGARSVRQDRRRAEPTLGVIVGSILGLLALLLAFTFSIAASRYEERRSAVLDEANAIGTAYLRADLLPDAERAAARRLLHEYVLLRVDAAVDPFDSDIVAAAVVRSQDIHAQLWNQGVAVAETAPTVLTNLYLQALNTVIDLHTRRTQAGLHSAIPLSIWAALIAVTGIGLAMSGYEVGSSRGRRGLANFGLVIALSIVLSLIADLDNPRRGLLRTTQMAITDLEAWMSTPDTAETR